MLGSERRTALQSLSEVRDPELASGVGAMLGLGKRSLSEVRDLELVGVVGAVQRWAVLSLSKEKHPHQVSIERKEIARQEKGAAVRIAVYSSPNSWPRLLQRRRSESSGQSRSHLRSFPMVAGEPIDAKVLVSR
jgi:hypothetical protein